MSSSASPRRGPRRPSTAPRTPASSREPRSPAPGALGKSGSSTATRRGRERERASFGQRCCRPCGRSSCACRTVATCGSLFFSFCLLESRALLSTGRFRPAAPCSARPLGGRVGRRSARPGRAWVRASPFRERERESSSTLAKERARPGGSRRLLFGGLPVPGVGAHALAGDAQGRATLLLFPPQKKVRKKNLAIILGKHNPPPKKKKKNRGRPRRRP